MIPEPAASAVSGNSLEISILEPQGNVRTLDLIPESERSPREGNGSPLQYSYLENSMDRGPWWAAIYEVMLLNILTY